jgi:deoxyhypusine synthase
MENTTKEN